MEWHILFFIFAAVVTLNFTICAKACSLDAKKSVEPITMRNRTTH